MSFQIDKLTTGEIRVQHRETRSFWNMSRDDLAELVVTAGVWLADHPAECGNVHPKLGLLICERETDHDGAHRYTSVGFPSVSWEGKP